MPPAPQQNPKNKTWLFVLGREPLLSAAEITAVFEQLLSFPRMRKSSRNVTARSEASLPLRKHGRQSPALSFPRRRESSQQYLIIETDADINPQLLIKRLGGTIKIAEQIDVENKPENIAEFLHKYIHEGKIIFSINEARKNYGLEIKKEIKKFNRSVRYIEPKNTATILHNNLVDKGADLTVVDGKIFVTRAIQPIEELGERDFGRPGRDDLSGMLPPKLAMIMINLSQAPREAVILDPFCGSGTMITEAMLMGYTNLIGADVSEKAVEDTKKNIEWVASLSFPRRRESSRAVIPAFQIVIPAKAGIQSPIATVDSRLRGNDKIIRGNDKIIRGNDKMRIFQSNIKDIAQKISAHSIDAIITEPYLGKPLKGNETENELRAQTEELSKLYIQSFEQFKKILKPNATVIFIIPEFKFRNNWIKVDCVEEIKKMGFAPISLLHGYISLPYARADQRVKRVIWKFACHCERP